MIAKKIEINANSLLPQIKIEELLNVECIRKICGEIRIVIETLAAYQLLKDPECM